MCLFSSRLAALSSFLPSSAQFHPCSLIDMPLCISFWFILSFLPCRFVPLVPLCSSTFTWTHLRTLCFHTPASLSLWGILAPIFRLLQIPRSHGAVLSLVVMIVRLQLTDVICATWCSAVRLFWLGFFSMRFLPTTFPSSSLLDVHLALSLGLGIFSLSRFSFFCKRVCFPLSLSSPPPNPLSSIFAP